MFDRWGYSILRDQAGEGEGGGTATATETAEAKELREVREENARLKTERDAATQDAAAWSERALRASRTAEPAAAAPKDATPEEIETGEQLLDDVSKDGLAALRKRGFVRIDEVKQLIAESIERAQGDGRAENNYQQLMQSEFPEMLEDLARVNKGLKPESPLFIAAAGIYRDAYELDPDLKGSKSALIMATRQAAAQLQLEGKRKVDTEADRQADRRQRIDRQKPDRSSKSDVEEEVGLSAKQKQMAADMGISEEKFMKQQEKIRGQRGK